eukprot:g6771.t1
MSSSNLNVGTRVYLKRKVDKPEVTRQGVDDAVKDIVETVRRDREKGARSYARRFDKWNKSILVSKEDIERAIQRVPYDVKKDIVFAHRQIESFARAQREALNGRYKYSFFFESLDALYVPFTHLTDTKTVTPGGVIAGSKVLPVNCAGCYVPGGRYAHIASALMTVTTAKAAGVPIVVASSPPKDEHGIHPAVVFALVTAGVDHILCIGGAQALASMAFGLFTGHRADVLVGPGNRFVVSAKRMLFGEVGIDMIAGPTEACVLADHTADPLVVATDLVSQAEHGPDSPCVLVTTSRELGEKVNSLIPELIKRLPNRSLAAATVSWRDYGEIIVVNTRKECADVSDEIASEHLEVHCADLDWWHANLRNYGSLFLGEETCIAFGDKTSGPNHVLPTRKAARYSGGLNVAMFTKTVTYQRMSRNVCGKIAPFSARISRAEGMEGHARSSDVRMKKYFPTKRFDLETKMPELAARL